MAATKAGSGPVALAGDRRSDTAEANRGQLPAEELPHPAIASRRQSDSGLAE